MVDFEKIQNKRDKIINVALRVFAAKGYQNTKISEICKDAGFSEAAIYEYFGSKEELMFAIPEKMAIEFLNFIQEVMPLIQSVEERIRLFAKVYIQNYKSNPDYASLCLFQLVSFSNFHQSKAYEIMRKTRDILRDCISEGAQTGIFKQGTDPYLVLAMIVGTIDAMFIGWHLKGMPSNQDITKILEPLIDLILEGIRAKTKDFEIVNVITSSSMTELKDILQKVVVNSNTSPKKLKK